MPERDQREQANQDRQSQMGGNSFESMNNERGNSGRSGSMNESMGRDGNGKRGTSNRGFAAMSPERQKAIASEGGRAAHRQGVAHEWSSEEARQAGRKGNLGYIFVGAHLNSTMVWCVPGDRLGGTAKGQRRRC